MSDRPGAPTLRTERALIRAGHEPLACVDEVGRGALAGPVTVGVVVLDRHARSAPPGVRDSKLLTPDARHALLPKLRAWPSAWAVGHAEPSEIDDVGIIAALRVAAARAIAQVSVPPAAALLDGNHDWLTQPAGDGLFPDPRLLQAGGLADLSVIPPRVTTRIRADMTCSGVAAASVLAKCARDAIMADLSPRHPAYGWDRNKGYAAREHADALRRLGPSAQHRRSWNLPHGPADAHDSRVVRA